MRVACTLYYPIVVQRSRVFVYTTQFWGCVWVRTCPAAAVWDTARVETVVVASPNTTQVTAASVAALYATLVDLRYTRLIRVELTIIGVTRC